MINFLLLNALFAQKTLTEFKEIKEPLDLEPIHTINKVDFFLLEEKDQKIFFHQNIPCMIEKIVELEKILLDGFGEFSAFDRVVVNGKVYSFDHSYISGDSYFQVFSKGFFRKEYLYVTFKGLVTPLSYKKVGNVVELSGDIFLRIVEGFKTVGYYKRETN